MASIRTQIELYDAISAPLYNISNALNMTISSFEDMQSTANNSFDGSNFEGAREEINQATIAIRQMEEALNGISNPNINVPTNNAPVQEPVEVPMTWRSDNLDVFTNTGVERFNQEVQSANNMLNRLNSTQEQIARQAANTDIFPENMINDLNSMGGRIERIRTQIAQIENNPMNMGTDIANNELEQLRHQLSQAVDQQEELNQAIQRMDVDEANQAYMRLSQTVGGTERYIRDNVDAQGQFNNAIRNGTSAASSLESKLIGLVATYATIQSATKVLNISDTMTQTTARLNMMNDGLQKTQDLQNMIYLAAERSRGSYQASADAVSKMGIMAKDAFKSNTELIAFVEQLNKQFTIAGTSQEGISAAMLQLTQAMGSGVLRGEELNSVFEQAPTIIQSIADYLNVPIGKIREMAQDGKLSAQVVKNALLSAADETNKKFNEMPKTFGQIWTSIGNDALMAFDPVLDRLNEIANSEGFQVMISGITDALVFISGLVIEIFDLITQVSSFMAENWSILEPIILGVATALGIYTLALITYNTVQGITNIIKGIATLQANIHAAALMMESGATFAATAAQYGFNTALLACPITWIILGIIAIITVIYLAVAAFNKFAGTSVSATGIIVGVLAVAAAFVGNLFVTLINMIIDIIGVVWNFIAVFAEFFANVFNDPIESIIRLFAGMADTVLGILEGIASAIDTIFGSNLAGAVSGWRSSLDGAVKDLVGEAEIKVPRMDTSAMHLDRFQYGQAWDAGYKFGEGIEDTVSNFDIGKLFGKGNIPNPNDYANAMSGLGSVPSNVADTAKNTGAIKDSVDISQEDLKYLRDLAETEVINRFTTAEIKVEQINHNNINNEMDLDGVINYLGEGVNEAMEKAAEGVHD
ncbi:MAG: tape measure protein [Clostridium argentinense]|nr:tape measure protein [Clostridium argentinense]